MRRKKEKGDNINFNKFINNMLRPENRKLLFIYVIVGAVILISLLNFLASFFIILIVFGVIFGSGIWTFIRKMMRKQSAN